LPAAPLPLSYLISCLDETTHSPTSRAANLAQNGEMNFDNMACCGTLPLFSFSFKFSKQSKFNLVIQEATIQAPQASDPANKSQQ
jgi:hypothetical protein